VGRLRQAAQTPELSTIEPEPKQVLDSLPDRQRDVISTSLHDTISLVEPRRRAGFDPELESRGRPDPGAADHLSSP